MKCSRYFSFVLFALLGVFFGSFIINQNDTYAVEDLVYSFNTSSSTNQYLCGYNNLPSCSSYTYIYIQFPSSNLDTSCEVYFRYWTLQYNERSLTFIPNGFYLISSSFSRFRFSNFASNACSSFTDTFTVTLTNNNPFASGITPSGSIELTENGTYDVSQYAEAVVNVSETDCPPSSGGDYHNDLVAINNSIMICAATCLVIYFFYCIYRMIIKNSGVK